MSSIPGNVFDHSIPLRPGHLPGIQPTSRSYMPVDRHMAYRTYASDEHGWTLVQSRRSRRNKGSSGWKGSADKKNIILI